jgi:hypothetical protein
MQIPHPKEAAMTTERSLAALKDDERYKRNRLAVYRAKLYSSPEKDGPAAQQRLRELERAHAAALARLREGREKLHA